jgi:hypothetical protein
MVRIWFIIKGLHFDEPSSLVEMLCFRERAVSLQSQDHHSVTRPPPTVVPINVAPIQARAPQKRQDESRFAEIEFASDVLHALGRNTGGVRQNRELITAERETSTM